jgi:hypothetical protein
VQSRLLQLLKYGTYLPSHSLTALNLCLALLKYLISFDCPSLIINKVTL